MDERIVRKPKDLIRCIRCVMPETQETIVFDNEGVCSTCRNIDIKHETVDWGEKIKEFKILIEKYRGKHPYDCLIPFSGGKDSTYAVYSLIKDYGLKPLVYCYDHHMYRPKHLENMKRTQKKLGYDFIRYQTNWNLVKKLMRVGLERKGDIYWYQHTGIFASPMHVAIKFKIPLILWGEPSSEYTAYYGYDEQEEVDEERFNKFVNLGITAEDMIGFLNDPTVTPRDLQHHSFPKRKELQELGCRSVCLGSYQPWDVKKQVAIIEKELGWQGDVVEGVPPEYNYEKIEDMLQGVQDYLKYIKRGYGRMSHLASIDIRNGRMTRETAMEMLDKWEGKRPQSLDVLLKWLDLTEEEFYKITKKHAVKPWDHDPDFTESSPRLPDQDSWIIE